MLGKFLDFIHGGQHLLGCPIVAGAAPANGWDQVDVVKAGLLEPLVELQGNLGSGPAGGQLVSHRLGNRAENYAVLL